ncbi:hypothetical protein [Aquisphaera insulae]|uniref:hypothetical protein n=1 Tax=Aquisphaera insulae TaxID=2712864 RepID=UPI0013EBE26B|nr:hypothetical protein [Aquisphaera insulae]
MSVNRYKDHVYVIPEDDADRQIINGFLTHDAVALRPIEVRGPAGGWPRVQSTFVEEYVPLLRKWPRTHVIMVIDFDEDVGRRSLFDEAIPEDLRHRVFLIGSASTPEKLRSALGKSFEEIGRQVAEDCLREVPDPIWLHDLLKDNEAEFQRLGQTVRPIVLPGR